MPLDALRLSLDALLWWLDPSFFVKLAEVVGSPKIVKLLLTVKRTGR
jgi:hypothetical protein